MLVAYSILCCLQAETTRYKHTVIFCDNGRSRSKRVGGFHAFQVLRTQVR